MRDGLIKENPYSQVKRLKVPRFRNRGLTGEEIGLLLSRLQGKDRLTVSFGLLHGLRLNVVLRLK